MLALLVSGCGGGGAGVSESAQIRVVVLRYFAAYARGSGAELCPLLTGGAQQTMVEVADSGEEELGRSSTARTCLQAVRFFGPVLQAENTKVLSVSITATGATARVKAGSLRAGSVFLSRTAAGWIISRLPGAA